MYLLKRVLSVFSLLKYKKYLKALFLFHFGNKTHISDQKTYSRINVYLQTFYKALLMRGGESIEGKK